jgi:protein required for attachment to host cells
VAFAKFLGLMRESLSKEAQKLIQREMTKDISSYDEKDIAAFYVNNRLP